MTGEPCQQSCSENRSPCCHFSQYLKRSKQLLIDLHRKKELGFRAYTFPFHPFPPKFVSGLRGLVSLAEPARSLQSQFSHSTPCVFLEEAGRSVTLELTSVPSLAGYRTRLAPGWWINPEWYMLNRVCCSESAKVSDLGIGDI